MRTLFFFLTVFFLSIKFSSAQGKISTPDLKVLQKKEDSLKLMAKSFLTEAETADRMRQDSLFVKTLIRSLQVRHSFEYPFDSVRGVSHLYSPDSTFRIFTWQLSFDNDYAFNRQRGAIQMRTNDGALKLIPLLDYSEYAQDPNDSARTRNNWIGAVYYNIIKTQHNGRAYYTLFGFDGNSYRTNKKWLDVLSFDAQNNPVFGAQQFFTFEKDSVKRKSQFRYSMEYKKEASTTLNFDEDMQMIIVDHLISETNEPEYAWTFVPDGDYEGFKWVNGKWQHVDKVYDFKLEDGAFPMPDALKDNQGNSDELKPSERTKKNLGEKEQPKPAPKKPVKKG
ncbi:MAG TPA: hypothetical protein VGB71_01590 [Flavisolibacter sp.]